MNNDTVFVLVLMGLCFTTGYLLAWLHWAAPGRKTPAVSVPETAELICRFIDSASRLNSLTEDTARHTADAARHLSQALQDLAEASRHNAEAARVCAVSAGCVQEMTQSAGQMSVTIAESFARVGEAVTVLGDAARLTLAAAARRDPPGRN